MKYRLGEDVFFKKVADDTVNIIKYNDDDFIYKLNNMVAKVFLKLESGIEEDEVIRFVEKETGAPSSEVVKQIIKDLLELSILQKN